MRWLVELGMRAGPALLVPPLGAMVAAALLAMRRAAHARLTARRDAAAAALGPPSPDPFAAPGAVVTLDGAYDRDPADERRAWLVVGDRRVALLGTRRLLLGSAEPWRPDGRRSLARGAVVRARGALRRADDEPDAWSLAPEGDAIPVAAVERAALRDVPYAAWSAALAAALLAALVALSVAGRWALARVDAAPRPVAMTRRGMLWRAPFTAGDRARLALASVSPLHHRAALRALDGGAAREAALPWLDPAAMGRVRAAVHAAGDCALEAEFVRRTGEEPPPDDRCRLRARVDAQPLARAIRDEVARAAPPPDDRLACMQRLAGTLRARVADPTFPFLLRDAAACVRDAAAVCGPLGCPDAVTVDLARLVIEHRLALRATTYGALLRPPWWRRPSLLRATVRRLASVGTALAVDALDARYARGQDWPQGFTWASVAETMRGFPTTPRDHRPIVAHLPGVGVDPAELANPWSSLELRAASSNARLAALVEWWRLGEYVPARDAPAREKAELARRAVAAAASGRVGPVIEALGDPTLESVEALALVAYRLTAEREAADAWLRAAPHFLPPDPSDRAARCRLRTALRQAAQRLRRAELLAATPWAAEASRACAFGDAPPVAEAPAPAE
jgi:hypothetical protein